MAALTGRARCQYSRNRQAEDRESAVEQQDQFTATGCLAAPLRAQTDSTAATGAILPYIVHVCVILCCADKDMPPTGHATCQTAAAMQVQSREYNTLLTCCLCLEMITYFSGDDLA